MTVAAAPTHSPTALDLYVADAFERAAAVASAWAAAPLNPRLQAEALAYLTELAPEDRELTEAWAREPGLRQRVMVLHGEGTAR